MKAPKAGSPTNSRGRASPEPGKSQAQPESNTSVTRRRRSPAATGPSGPDERRQRIALAAYYRAERRGFAPGHEVDDWLAAEAEIE